MMNTSIVSYIDWNILTIEGAYTEDLYIYI